MKTEHTKTRILPAWEWIEENASPMSMSDLGWCVNCGEEVDGCEPDTRPPIRLCETCGKAAIYGASELLLEGLYTGGDE